MNLSTGVNVLLLRRSLCPLLSAPLLVIATFFWATQAIGQGTINKPNVVFIFADDLGWSDTTLFGTTKLYRTPNIERLAKRGMTFSRAYSASPLCSPTRASVLTGLSPARTGITTPNCHLPQVVLQAREGTRAPANQVSISPQPVTRLATQYTTIVDVLREAGYATGHFGKWHLGHPPYSPLEHGFDVDIPHWPGPGPAGSYVAPWRFPDFDPQTPDEHIEDRMAEEAVEFMKTHRDRPFFVNYWMFSVHAPFDAKAELIQSYRSRIDPQDPQRSPIYAAMVESMDDAVGTLIDTLDDLGLADNTIIVFASDNGGNMYNDVEGTTATSNAPLRGGKATMYEGGIRVPMIIAWPGHVPAESKSETLTNSCDFFPTLLEMLSLETPAETSFDGVSLVPALHGQPLQREAIFTYFPHNPPVPDWMPPAVSVHRGDWKLIRIFFGGEDNTHRYQLYNLREDIGETRNVAAEHPELVRELDNLIEDFLLDTKAVLPLPNPAFDRANYRIENEGKPGVQHIGGQPKKQKREKPKTTAGWSPSGHCTLSINNQTLVVRSTGGDPHVTYELGESIPAGDLVLEMTISSDAKGAAQVFWQEAGVAPKFHASRSQTFDVEHDGQPHRYDIAFSPKNDVLAMRLDPARSGGTIHISDLQLRTASGKIIKTWNFKP